MAYGSFSYGSVTYGGSIGTSPTALGRTKIRPKVLLRYGRINEPIRVPIYDLLVDSETTFLTQNETAGLTTILVKNISSFEINQILLIGIPGNEGSEIIKTSSTVAPVGSTITLASPLKFDHNATTPIYIINFDVVEYWTATTVDGLKTFLASLDIKADNLETDYNDIVFNDGYYFARWKNSITGAFSPYSDGVPMISYTPFMARSIIQKALGDINKDTSDILTDEFAFLSIENCVTEVLREQKRWSFMNKFDVIIDNAKEFQWKVPMPDDIEDENTNKSIYQYRLGVDDSMTWVDKEQFDTFLESVAYSTVAADVLIGDAQMLFDSTDDFEDAGSVQIAGDVLAYTANNRTTNVLTLTVPVTANYLTGTDVFQFAEVGRPLYWTSYEGFIYNYPIVDKTRVGRNFKLDYYAKQPIIKSDTDLIPFPDPTLVMYYLEWKFLVKLNNGSENDDSEGKKKLFKDRLTKLVQKQVLGRTFRLKKRINDWSRQESFGFDNETERDRLGNFDTN